MQFEIPRLKAHWVEFAQASDSPYVRDVGPALTLWEQGDLVTDFGWVQDSAESLQERLQGATQDEAASGTVDAFDADYEAALMLTAWKVFDLVSAGVQRLNADRVAPAAALARGALEASAVAPLLFERRHRAIKSRGAELHLFAETLEKMLHGSTTAPTGVERLHALTALNRVVKVSTDPETKDHLIQVYERLCDVVHPSANGHQSYWQSHVETDNCQRLHRLSFEGINERSLETGALCLWAFGWSSVWTIRVLRPTRGG